MSSRNAYLESGQRKEAPRLYEVLCETVRRIQDGGTDLAELEQVGNAELREAGFVPEYLRILRSRDLKEPGPTDQELIVLVAARLGRARLIDNLAFKR
jgi:pantoate--beta-alanine ligase